MESVSFVNALVWFIGDHANDRWDWSLPQGCHVKTTPTLKEPARCGPPMCFSVFFHPKSVWCVWVYSIWASSSCHSVSVSECLCCVLMKAKEARDTADCERLVSVSVIQRWPRSRRQGNGWQIWSWGHDLKALFQGASWIAWVCP